MTDCGDITGYTIHVYLQEISILRYLAKYQNRRKHNLRVTHHTERSKDTKFYKEMLKKTN
jgi:hypothetical protein